MATTFVIFCRRGNIKLMYGDYSHFSDIYDPYTSAPNYEYLFKPPSGLGRNPTITDPKSIYGETKDPGTTTVYETLPPPPKKFSILSASENFADGAGAGNVSRGYTISPEVIIILILVFLVWMLLSRTNKIIKVMKKMMKREGNGIHGGRDGDDDDDGFLADLY